MHVTGFLLGAYAGNSYVRIETELVKDINQIRADKGMPALVGSQAWIRYTDPEEK